MKKIEFEKIRLIFQWTSFFNTKLRFALFFFQKKVYYCFTKKKEWKDVSLKKEIAANKKEIASN